MKKLQRNFTTPEQSKLLLELGVPENSADCYNTIKHIGKIPDGMTYKNVWQMSIWRNKNGSHIEMYPCWSVGRLIEIYLICNEVIDNVTELHHSAIKIDVREFNIVEYIICKLTNKIKKNKDFLSKLEE